MNEEVKGVVFHAQGEKIIPASVGNTADNCWKLDMSGEAHSPQQSEFPSGFITGSFLLTIPQLSGLEDPFLPSFPSLNWRTWTWEGGNNDEKLTIRVHTFCSPQTAHLP